MENDTNPASRNTNTATSSFEQRSNVKKMNINLLKRSKHDLLRLLSILEGELEARDIYISTLEAQLNNQRNAKNQYFVHRLNDPFLSLHRDDYLFSGGDAAQYHNELAHIEPLPLLEKVVSRFKNQQHKMHHQMALASKIHRKMAHELAEEKRKHCSTGKSADDAMLATEKERENLNVRIMCERERTRRIEREYKKLLLLCKKEGKRHKLIVLTLVAEQEKLRQQLNHSKELQIDQNSTEPELQARLQEALREKQELTMKVTEEQCKMDELRTEYDKLQMELRKQAWLKNNDCEFMDDVFSEKKGTALQQASALYSSGNSDSDEDSDDNSDDDYTFLTAPELPVKMSKQTLSTIAEMGRLGHRSSNPDTLAFFSKHHPMSVAQSTQDVTLIPTSSHPPILLADGVGVTTSGYYCVKPGSSIAGLDAMKSAATSKEMLRLDVSKDGGFNPVLTGQLLKHASEHKGESDEMKRSNTRTVPPKPNRFTPGTIGYIPFRSPHSLFNDISQPNVLSSPTSGAANFSMNSPNSPNVPQSSPFAITRSSTVKANAKIESGKGDQTKLGHSLKMPSPARASDKNSQFQATRMKFQNVPTVTSNTDPNSSLKESSTDKKSEQKQKKSIPATYKSPISQRAVASTALPTVLTATKADGSVNESDKIKQPLPPKTKPSNCNQSNGNQVRPPPLPPKSPVLASDAPIKRSPSASHNCRTPEPTFQRKSGSVIKRIAPLTPSTKGNEYSSNGSVNKMSKGPAPPTLPVKKSSRHPTPPAGPRQSHSALNRSTSNES